MNKKKITNNVRWEEAKEWFKKMWVELKITYDTPIKKMNKEELKQRIEELEADNARIELENSYLNKQVEQNEKDMKAMENALLYKEKVIDKYKQLLETAVEHL